MEVADGGATGAVMAEGGVATVCADIAFGWNAAHARSISAKYRAKRLMRLSGGNCPVRRLDVAIVRNVFAAKRSVRKGFFVGRGCFVFRGESQALLQSLELEDFKTTMERRFGSRPNVLEPPAA
jgi:hypothetical protein